MSKTAVNLHIVFATKHRVPAIPMLYREDVYRFIWKELKELKCFLVRIGGVQDHIHMLVDVNPTISLSALMARIKSKSSGWMRQDSRFPDFQGWAEGYYAASVSPEARNNVIEYIKNQPEHHLNVAFQDEVMSFCSYNGLRFDLRDID